MSCRTVNATPDTCLIEHRELRLSLVVCNEPSATRWGLSLIIAEVKTTVAYWTIFLWQKYHQREINVSSREIDSSVKYWNSLTVYRASYCLLFWCRHDLMTATNFVQKWSISSFIKSQTMIVPIIGDWSLPLSHPTKFSECRSIKFLSESWWKIRWWLLTNNMNWSDKSFKLMAPV